MMRWLPLLSAFLLAPALPGCSEGGEDANAPARRAVLASVGQNAILPTLRDFDAEAASLVTATETYAASLDPADLAAAQQAWVDAMAVWERAELMQVGPAGPAGETPAGRDLRDEIYSWPTTNACRIDQETVEQTYQDATRLDAEPVNVRGLDAIEYLLFDEDTTNACSLTAEINQSGAWGALGDPEILQRRADYAVAAAELVRARAADLLTAWEPSGEDFLFELAEAGLESTTYGTSQDALNAVSDAMFYLDTQTKDMKVAEPVGIVAAIGCVDPICPQELESRWANRSKEHVLENLRGFALVFRGGPGDDPTSEGFDDLLTDLGPDGAELATQMNDRLDAAIAQVEGTSGTFADLLTSDPQAIRDIHAAIKLVTDLLKTQFLGLLDLSPPASAPMDND